MAGAICNRRRDSCVTHDSTHHIVELMKRYSKPEYQGSGLRRMVEMAKKSAEMPIREAPSPSQEDRMDRRLSSETIAELAQADRDGIGTPELRRRYKISQGSVLKLLRAHGVTMRAVGTNQHGEPSRRT